jgi:integrase
MTVRQTRVERAATPLARDSIRKMAEATGGCLRPVQLRRTDTVTGETVPVMVPCGATLASICPPCAERTKALRAAQCREGWHLEDEPDLTPGPPDEMQEFCLILRAEAQLRRDTAAAAGQDISDYDALIGELDIEITRAGIRGAVTTHRGSRGDGSQRSRRLRSTRRRQDAPPLPARKIAPRTVGTVYTSPDGKRYRPSMFLTLTCDSYGKVRDDGTPADPAAYDYVRAARDAIHFAALFDRFIQNLRRVLGYEAQYFGGVEPQKRLAPHIHLAVRDSVPRPLLRQVLGATYHQVWWPAADTVRFSGDQLPVWEEGSGNYLDPASGEVLQTWDDALDAIGPHDAPRHVARFGPKFDAQGVLAGSKDANKCVGYLTKYLTKQVAECHVPETDAQRAHADRLAEALRYEPCSPTCANWLRYGIQPKNPRPGLIPGACKGGGKPRSTKPGEKPGHPAQNFLQLIGERRDGGRWRHDRPAHHRGSRRAIARLRAHRALAAPGRPIRACDQGWPPPGMGCSRRCGLAGISPRTHGGGLMGVQRYTLRSGAVRYRGRVKFHGREVAARVFERRADAIAWEQDQRRRLRLGEWTDPRRGRVPLSDVAAEWLNSRGLVKRRTRESDESNWRNYVRPRFGNWPVAAITAAEVSAWVGGLVDRGLAPATATRALATLRSILAFAVADGRVHHNVAAAVRRPTSGRVRREGQALTLDEVHALTAACVGPYRDVVPVLALVGLRWGELVGLQVGDRVSVPGPGLRLSRALLASEGGGALYVDTLKNNRARTVPLVAELVPIIDRWSAGKQPNDWLFDAPKGGPLRESNWKRSVGWRAAKASAGVPGVRVHDLRHTAASLWLAAGADPKVVQRVLGHATAAMTMDLYGHLVDASLWQAARLIGGTTGASEPPEEPVRTENESGRNAKNPH